MGDIGKYFNRSEIVCKCGCGFDAIDPTLVTILDSIREQIGPLQILSGCRCEKHNQAVGGKENSAHTRGKAVDIKCMGSTFRYVFTKLATQKFRRIGQYKNWIHVDIDESLPQIVMWFK